MEMTNRSTTCCIVGAGYSFIAGLPLAKDLLSTAVAVFSRSAEKRFEKVREDYAAWQKENPEGATEQYLSYLFEMELRLGGPPFEWAVELVAAVLATPRATDLRPITGRYGGRLTRPSWCCLHTYFWSILMSFFTDISVVTTNYDLLIERSLRHKRMKRLFGPGFYYGGIPQPQVLKGTAQPFTVTNPQCFITLDGTIPVYKLHGSLNWSIENEELRLYQDMRPAFRHGGKAAIIPPIPEKIVPSWLTSVWTSAEHHLTSADVWFVCGYSLPEYDTAVCNLFKKALGQGSKKIFLLDPKSEILKEKFEKLSPNANAVALRGLPQGIDDILNMDIEFTTTDRTQN